MGLIIASLYAKVYDGKKGVFIISIHSSNFQLVDACEKIRIQKSNRHDSGFALRFPRIKNIREDKNVSDIDSLQKVKQIYENVLKSRIISNYHP